MSPVVSVVIPTIGSEYVWATVSSVLAQTFTDFELVLVADGYDGPLLDDIAGADARVRVIRQEHLGKSVARNVGVANSVGRLIAFLDDDDLCMPTRLDVQVARLGDAPLAATCHCSFQTIDGSGDIIQDSQGGSATYVEMLRTGIGMLMSTMMVRRDACVAVGGFDPCLITGEDIDFYMRLAMIYPSIFVPESLVQYRRHGRNSSGDPWNVYQDIEPILRKHRLLAELQGDPVVAAAASEGLANLQRYAAGLALGDARIAMRQRRVGRAARLISESLRLAPSALPAALRRKVDPGLGWSTPES